MTTLDPGASEVFTHGLTDSPRSTAFLASSPAPIITLGLEVFVHDVIAAMTTWPWSSSVSVPSASLTGAWACARSATATGSWWCGAPSPSSGSTDDGGSEAGNDSDA